MRNLTTKEMNIVSGGEFWVMGNEKYPALVVTKDSVGHYDDLVFYAGHVEHAPPQSAKIVFIGHNGQFMVNEKYVTVAPYYEADGTLTGSCYMFN